MPRSDWRKSESDRRLSDLVSVGHAWDTGDALLVTTKAHAQRVKELPGAWKERGRGGQPLGLLTLLINA